MFKLSENIDNAFLVSSKDLEGRLDPHFYLPEFQNLTKNLKKQDHRNLGELVRFSNETWNQKKNFENDFPYIEISEVDTTTGEIGNIKFIPKKEAPSRAKKIVRENDIIISTTRPNRGAISFIDERYDFNIASTGFLVLREIKDKEISREYLFFILRQFFILKQMEQRSSGGNYPAITEEELKKIIIPFPTETIQKKVVNRFKEAYAQKQQKEAQAKNFLAGIDEYLLGELGITSPEKDNSLANRIFKTSFQKVTGNRLDPDYYSLYYSEIEKSVSKSIFKVIKLDDILSFIGSGKTPASSEYSKEKTDYPIVKVGSYTNEFVDLDKVSYCQKPQIHSIEKNDIFILSAAHQAQYVGRHIKYLDKEPEIPTSFVGELVGLRINIDLASPMFIYSLLNLEIYKTLINREKTGQTSHVYGKNIKKIKIPLPDLEKQKEIAATINKMRYQAQRLQQEAKQELESARKEVEQMILNEK
jgi:restriction endonuclease S subunit